MANGNPDPFLERAKFFREHVQAIITLAAGAILLSLTFVHDLAPQAEHGSYLVTSWWIFLATILLGLSYNYVLAIYVTMEGKRYGHLLMIISFVFHASFVAAIFFLLRFGTMNLHQAHG